MKKKKFGSATLTIIVLGIISLIYGFSIYSDILHMQTTQDNYEKKLKENFNQKYEKIQEKIR